MSLSSTINFSSNCIFSQTSDLNISLPLSELSNASVSGNVNIRPKPNFKFKTLKGLRLNLVHINMRSLRNKILELEVFLNYLGNLLSLKGIRVLCISASWLLDDEIPSINFPNFKIDSFFCRKNKSGGGVINMIHENENVSSKFNCKFVNDMCVESQIEMCASSILVNHNEIRILTIYRPPNGNFEFFLKQIELTLSTIVSKSSGCIVCGDFNINFLDDTVQKCKLQSLFLSFNLKQLVKDATRGNAILDLVFTNLADIDFTLGVVDHHLSDHLAQVLSIRRISPMNNIIFKEVRIFNEQNTLNFLNTLSTVDWSSVFHTDTIVSFDQFLGIFLNSFQKCFSVRKVRIKHNSKPWWNKNLQEIKNFLKDMENLKYSLELHHVAAYKNLLKYYKDCIKEAKKSHLQLQIDSSRNKSKALWDIVNQKFRIKSALNNNLELKVGNSLTSDPELITNCFNKLFLANRNTHILSTNLSPSSKVTNSIFLSPVNEVEVRAAILSLKNCKACGVDNVPVSVVKAVADVITPPLVHCINKCFETGVFPAALKHTLVTPLFKKGDKTDPKNYRGIYISTTFGKLFESLLRVRLECFFDENLVISNSQHGFRKKKSITSANNYK